MRSLRLEILAILGASALAASSSAAMAATAPTPPTQAEKASANAYAQAKNSPGYAVYVAKGCYECHGYSGGGAMPPVSDSSTFVRCMEDSGCDESAWGPAGAGRRAGGGGLPRPPGSLI